jgi:hypothetical protein
MTRQTTQKALRESENSTKKVGTVKIDLIVVWHSLNDNVLPSRQQLQNIIICLRIIPSTLTGDFSTLPATLDLKRSSDKNTTSQLFSSTVVSKPSEKKIRGLDLA